MSDNKICAVVGSEGVVGSAVSRVFWEGGYDVMCIDPKLDRPCIRSRGEWPEIVKTDYPVSICNTPVSAYEAFEKMTKGEGVIFVCVPTPYHKGFDRSYLDTVLGDIGSAGFTGIVAVKSTVPPRIMDEVAELYKGRFEVAACPEFLNARTAYEDFKNADHIVLGGGPKKWKLVCDIHARTMGGINMYTLSSPGEAMMVKYTINCFFATKNVFFNMVNSYCCDMGYDYVRVIESVLADNRITNTHTEVPGPDGKLGFGGMCLPKDSLSMRDFINEYFKDFEIDLENILESVTRLNMELRPEEYKDK